MASVIRPSQAWWRVSLISWINIAWIKYQSHIDLQPVKDRLRPSQTICIRSCHRKWWLIWNYSVCYFSESTFISVYICTTPNIPFLKGTFPKTVDKFTKTFQNCPKLQCILYEYHTHYTAPEWIAESGTN